MSERGSAPVEFVLVAIVLTMLFAGLLQLGFDLHVRDVLEASAAEGARYGADADRTPADGAALTRRLVTAALSARFAADVAGTMSSAGGVPEVAVTVRAPLPVLGPYGPAGTLTVTGHAVAEGR